MIREEADTCRANSTLVTPVHWESYNGVRFCRLRLVVAVAAAATRSQCAIRGSSSTYQRVLFDQLVRRVDNQTADIHLARGRFAISMNVGITRSNGVSGTFQCDGCDGDDDDDDDETYSCFSL